MRKPTYASLKKKLDQVFSIWVRRGAADHRGMASCVSCGAVKRWQELQCGHFVSRIRLVTRWEPRNCAPQCGACNVLRRGNPIGFARYLLSTYGPDILDKLDEQSREPVTFSRSNLQDLIDVYKLPPE